MGLGFFIAKTLLERTGALVTFSNGRPHGAVVSARWPRAQIEARRHVSAIRTSCQLALNATRATGCAHVRAYAEPA